MHFDESLTTERDIESAINRQPLLVTPETPLFEVVVLMTQSGLDSQKQSILAGNPGSNHAKCKTSSFALVMKDEKLLGIFTERDIVKLAAEGRDIQTLTVGEVMTPQVITLPINSLRDLFGPLFLFRRYKIRHLPIVGDRGELIGIISQDGIRQLVKPTDFLKLKRVSEVMTTPVIVAPLQALISEIAQLMTIHGVSCVVITQDTEVEGEENRAFPVGIVTERDILHFQALKLDMSQTSVDTVMSSPLFLLQPEDTLWTAYQEMQNRQVRRLVVSWDWGEGIGIITETNLLQSLEIKEIFEVEESIEKTFQQVESQTIQQILNHKINHQEKLERLLAQVSDNLDKIFRQNYISLERQQSQIESVLLDVEEMQVLVCQINQETKDLQKIAQANLEDEENIHQKQQIIEGNINEEEGEQDGREGNLPKHLPQIATGS
ncbi:histidine kinase like sensor protein [Calothrix sp. NIES-4101]|nr:histidine kinase like sensor protein [Calothrix sp. NIES-4101]